MSIHSRRHRKARLIRAAAENDTPIVFDASMTIEAAADGVKARRFNIMAYGGGAVNVSRYPLPIVVDLAGLSFRGKQLPTYYGHHDGSDGTRLLGHSDKHDKADGKLIISGVFSAATSYVNEILAANDNGYEWQASIGARPEPGRVVEVLPGKQVNVNGQQFTGPILVARKSTLLHTAILPEGADASTRVSIAATAATHKENDMNPFEKWLTGLGLVLAELSDEAKAKLEAKFHADEDAPAPTPEPEPAPTPDPVTPAERIRAEAAAESTRVAEIMAVAAKHPMIQAKAIGEGWTRDKTEVEVLKAELPKPIVVHGSRADESPAVIEAALCMSAGLPKPEASFTPQVLEAASKQYRNIGLQEVILMHARANGYTGRETIHAGNCQEVIKAAFSTHSLTTLLSTTGNKFLLDGFNALPQSWREVAAVRSVSDFKTVTAFRLNASLEYEELGPAGEIKHGTVSQESYTLAAKTYAKMAAFTRQDIINDDLGALNDLRIRLGMGAAIKLNKVFWTAFLSASNGAAFWTAARGNLVTGSALAEAGLNTAVAAFRDMAGPDGNMMSLSPEILLVPTALEATAKKIYVSQEIRDTTSSTKYPTANIYQNMFRPVVVPELGNAAYTGYSATTWFLLANPSILACAVMCFLNGQQSPTIESADADFDTLGIQFRGFHDFGCAMTEYRASVKATAA